MLTELQLPTKTNFYGVIQAAATDIDQVMTKWKNLAEFIARVDIGDLDAIGVPAGVVRQDLIDFRTLINEIVALYGGAAVTPTNVPDEVIEKIRRM